MIDKNLRRGILDSEKEVGAADPSSFGTYSSLGTMLISA